MRTLAILTFLCLLPLAAGAEPLLTEVATSAKRDLKDALDRLAKQRQKQQLDKTPLVRKAVALEEAARSKRKEFDRRLKLKDNQESSLAELKEEVEEIDGDLRAALSLLSEYNRSWFDGMGSPEREFRREAVRQMISSDQDRTLPEGPWTGIEVQLDLAKVSIARLTESFGGLRFDGPAITPVDDVEEKGSFISLGPAAYFSSSETTAAGVVEFARSTEDTGGALDATTLTRPRPTRVLATPKPLAELIRATVSDSSGAAGSLPFDPTLGKAIILASSEPTLTEELAKGGVWIFPILAFALLASLVALGKALQILSVRIPSGQPDLNSTYRGPFRELQQAANENWGQSAEILEEVLYEKIIETQSRYEKRLPVIAVTAAAAPLLGLLGTVTGMIDVFQQLTHFANPENSELSRGISEALVTTKFGLVTAIPALVAHALLSRRVQGIVAKMERFASRFVSLAAEENKNGTPEKNEDDS